MPAPSTKVFEMAGLIAKISSFESMATLDGEGVRYGVFFTGCPLRCMYCHNPETWHRTKCELSAEELAAKLSRYKPYFSGGGGITFTGGEPLLQADFIADVAPMLAERGINYTLDTCGCVPLSDNVKKAVELSELIILDLKFYDEKSYKKYCGGDFELLKKFAEFLKSIKKRVWLRTVIVPGINDNEQAIAQYARIALDFGIAEKYELLAFHTLGFSKYENLRLDNPLSNTVALSQKRLAELQNCLDGYLSFRL